MTALADNRQMSQASGGAVPERTSLGVAAAKLIYAGALVLVTAAGYGIPGTSTSASGLVAAGVAVKMADNTTGNDGDVTVQLERGSFPFFNSATTDLVTIADIGRPCYVVDDQTVARTSNVGNRALAGHVEGVDADGTVWVRVGATAPSSASGVDIYLIAAADLRTSLGFFVKVDNAAKAALCGAGDFPIGVLMNAPNSGEVARIRIAGHARVVTTATPAKGALVGSDASGMAVAVTTGKTNTSDAGAAADPLIGSNVGAILLETGAASTLTACIVVLAGAVPTTNA